MPSKTKRQHRAKRSQHDTLVFNLEQRLRQTPEYDPVYRNYEYKTGKYSGECDVLLYNNKSGKWHYYEVKCNFSEKNFKKATEQYERLQKAYPSSTIRGIYYSPQCVRRM